MAAKAPARNRAARSGHVSPEQSSFDFPFEKANDPNADILLASLRSAGYSLEGVVGDLIDNSIDAHASVIVVNLDIDLHTEEWEVEIADDGFGMTEPVLDEMMKLGSRAEHDLDSGLGAFGLGSDTGALAIGRRKHVVTIAAPGAALSAMWDLDAVIEAKAFVKHQDAATADEVALFGAAFEKANADVPETGTLVRITKCERIGGRAIDTAAKHVRKYVGRTYRRFLQPQGGLTVIVNGETVEPLDPMMRHDADTQVLLDEPVEFTWKDGDGEQAATVGVTIVHLPDKGGPGPNQAAGITISDSGYYILRNGREIVSGATLGMFGRHAEFSRFRCELSFPAKMDSQLGVTFLKSSLSVKPTQGIRDKIESVTAPFRRQSRSLYKASKPEADEQIPHEEAAKQIKAKSPFLRKPEAEIEKREPREKTDAKEPTETKEPQTTRSPREQVQKALADQASFEARHAGPYAPFYEGSLDGRRVVVTYNADHPAYRRLILDNREDRGQIAAVDYLVWSLVAAELRNVDDEHARFAEVMREDASFNLRQLLTV